MGDPVIELEEEQESSQKAEEGVSEDEKKSGVDESAEAGSEEEKEGEGKEEKVVEQTPEQIELARLREENESLRISAREQRRELDRVTVEMAKVNEALTKADLIEKPDEKQQEEEAKLVAMRNAALSNIVEVMRVNPSYADVDEVVSESNFDDMIDAMTAIVVNNKGMNPREAEAQLRNEIWSLDNPYKFMYEQIKKYHPAYVKAEKEEKKEEKEVEIVKSIHNVPGSTGKGSWTAAAIDAMDEKDLDKVPSEIYAKYLRGQLK